MEQNLENKIDLKDRLFSIAKKNKIKIYSLLLILIIAIISIVLINDNKKKENIFLSKQYIKASIHLSSKEYDKAKKIYEEIITSKNKIYSILSLNSIIEKNLEEDVSTILNYFDILEKMSLSKESKDLLILKKALYLIKNSKIQEGNDLLNNLINNNSNLKSIIQEIQGN